MNDRIVNTATPFVSTACSWIGSHAGMRNCAEPSGATGTVPSDSLWRSRSSCWLSVSRRHAPMTSSLLTRMAAIEFFGNSERQS